MRVVFQESWESPTQLNIKVSLYFGQNQKWEHMWRCSRYLGHTNHIRKEANLNNILNDPIKASDQLTGAHSPSVYASPDGVPGRELRAALFPPAPREQLELPLWWPSLAYLQALPVYLGAVSKEFLVTERKICWAWVDQTPIHKHVPFN